MCQTDNGHIYMCFHPHEESKYMQFIPNIHIYSHVNWLRLQSLHINVPRQYILGERVREKERV